MAFKIESSFKNNSQEIKVRGKRVVGKSSYETGLIVEGQAKTLCPANYGYLRASINTQTVDKGTELEAPGKYGKGTKTSFEDTMTRKTFKKISKPTDPNECYVGTALEYGPYIEFGTIKSNAQPFLRPAGDLAQGKVLNIVQRNGKYEFGDYIK